ncbi:DUF2924 domain-containing protein [Devosia rhodophyticola]|uniref:DUF2924 domain-containing protein n=1 Tax=Devosia rhodophyticola TaxID=3026423 RepID=A0ABY7YXN9_9HYPH|nr:DUF2924 domain-containing protein [Devosia rhodophyticola]WDR06134.1 DUF2924 domain-containing protein [Devosia rhodophyticola]
MAVITKEDWRGHVLPMPVDLEGLSSPELSELMDRLYGADPRARLSRELMLRAVAFQIQSLREGRQGGLGSNGRGNLPSIRLAARRVEQAVRSKGVKAQPPIALDPGTRLVREWRGEVHEVVVQAVGKFLFQGKAWRSLSEIASTITGTKWSGPRFFGLRQIKGKLADA